MPVVRSAVASGDLIINLLPMSSFPSNGGVVLIDSEHILYANSTDTQLLGCTRGVNGTSAASHAVGAQITLIESAPFSPQNPPVELQAFLPPTLGLTDPTVTLTAAQVDDFRVVNVLLDSSGVNQTWTLPTPTSLTLTHLLSITFFSGASKTLSVNTISIASGSKHDFIWDVLNQEWAG